VRLEAPHAYSADLRLELTSPAGTTSLLADKRVLDRGRICRSGQGTAIECPSYDAAWPIATLRHLDEPAVGSWQLRIIDDVSGQSGQVDNWSLRVWGR
jgi:subtilisin-like proprotein convertase family protein